MKLTYEEKLRIYDLWKNQHYSPRRIAKQYNISRSVIRYMVNLMDRHGVEIIKHGKQKYYSPDFKINAIDRVLVVKDRMTFGFMTLGHETIKAHPLFPSLILWQFDWLTLFRLNNLHMPALFVVCYT